MDPGGWEGEATAVTVFARGRGRGMLNGARGHSGLFGGRVRRLCGSGQELDPDRLAQGSAGAVAAREAGRAELAWLCKETKRLQEENEVVRTASACIAGGATMG